MATYFAQSSSNINAANVWNTAANGSGSYLTWPPASGDVLMANNKTITINVDTDLGATGQVRNDTTGGATTGGGFTLSNGVTLTANVYSGANNTVNVVTFALAAPNSAAVVGNLYSGNSGNANALGVTGSGTVTVTGTVNAASSASSSFGISASAGTVTVTGDVYGGAGNGASCGIIASGTAYVTINGTVYGGTGSVGTYGALNNGSSTLIVNGTCYAGSGAPAVGLGANTQITLLSGPFVCNANGMQAVAAANWRWKSSPSGTYLQVRTNDLSEVRSLYTADSVGGNPSVSDVRSGTTYGPSNELTGTCHVPAAASVLYGVPVDAATGTATITASDIRAAIGLASANLDTQLSDLPTATENATAVWGAATRTLTESSGGGATAQDIWTYATRSLTEAPDVPTVEEIAAEVRTELTPELSRVAHCATVESTGDQLAGLL